MNDMLKQIETMSETLIILISFGTFVVALIAVLITLSKMNTFVNLKINENSLKLLSFEKDLLSMKHSFEKDLLSMKQDHDKEIAELKINFAHSVEKLGRENREDHKQLYDKIGEAVTQLTEVSTAFKVHSENSKRSFASIQNTTDHDNNGN